MVDRKYLHIFLDTKDRYKRNIIQWLWVYQENIRHKSFISMLWVAPLELQANTRYARKVVDREIEENIIQN